MYIYSLLKSLYTVVRNCNVKSYGGWPGSVKVLVFLSVFNQACGTDQMLTNDRIYSGLAVLNEAQLEQIDSLVREYTSDYRYISLGLILNGAPVLERYYGEDRSAKSDVYASVSKPLTAMICMQFLEQGLIRSLDDPIGEYCSRYRDVMPEEYSGQKISFTHLLSHRSGIPHHERIWSKGSLDLKFAPGERFMYSTRGYGVLGEVLSEIGNMSYNQLVKTYIGMPVGASTLRSPLPFFEAPGGLVQSTLGDMLLFAGGVMNSSYVDDSLLFNLAWVPAAGDPSGNMGLGWYLYKQGTEDWAVYHAGSNGKPRAFLVLKPLKKCAIVLLGKHKSPDGKQQFQELAQKIMEVILPN